MVRIRVQTCFIFRSGPTNAVRQACVWKVTGTISRRVFLEMSVSEKINHRWIEGLQALFKTVQTRQWEFNGTKEDVVRPLSAAPLQLIIVWPVNVKPIGAKWVKYYWSSPPWVSLALRLYQMQLIGNIFSLWSWEMCLSEVTFLLRFSDSL